MKIVLDTNIFIAAALKSGFAEDIIELGATSSEITLITSEEILSELEGKLLSKFNWSREKVDFFLGKIRSFCEVVGISEKLLIIKRDSQDNKILECAVAGRVDLIVSADQDLIKLKKFRKIGIVHPKTLGWIFPEYFKERKS